MFCARCGQQIPDLSDICPLCGRESTIQLRAQPATATSSMVAAIPTALSLSPTLALPQRKAIGGWLAFFCVVLTILTPLGNLTALQHSYHSWWGIYYFSIIVSSLVVGISLWMVHRHALTLLKNYFIVFAVWELFRIAYVLATSPNPSFDRPMVFRVRTLIWIAIWVSYFYRSQRVRETYGRNL